MCDFLHVPAGCQQAPLFPVVTVHCNLTDTCSFRGTTVILNANTLSSSLDYYALCLTNTDCSVQTIPGSGKQRAQIPLLHQLTQHLSPRRKEWVLPGVTLGRCQLREPALEGSPVIEAVSVSKQSGHSEKVSTFTWFVGTQVAHSHFPW